jgi:broad specificity phosphatase PhoE
MKTTLYLIRQGDALQPTPARPQPPLSRRGVRQAEVTRDFLALRPIDACYASARWCAVQTAEIIAAPHEVSVQRLAALDDDNGVIDPERSAEVIEDLLDRHAGGSILLVGERSVHLSYLAAVLHMAPEQAEAVVLEQCGISVVVRAGAATTVTTLNAAFHLQGLAA